MLTKWIWNKTVNSDNTVESGIIFGLMLLFPYVPLGILAVDVTILLVNVFISLLRHFSALAIVIIRAIGRFVRSFVTWPIALIRRHRELQIALSASNKQKEESDPEFILWKASRNTEKKFNLIETLPMPTEDKTALKNEELSKLHELVRKVI